MARPPDISTKSISLRVPMPDYIRFLTAASGANQSMSEFLTLRLYQEEKVKELEQKMTAKLSEKDKEVKNISVKLNKADQEVKTLSDQVKGLEKVNGLLESEKKTLQAEKTDISTQNAKRAAQSASNYNQISKSYDNLKREFELFKKEHAEIVARNERVISEYQKFVTDNLTAMEDIANSKNRGFIPEVQTIIDRIKKGK